MNVSGGAPPFSPFAGAAISLHSANVEKQLIGEQRAAAEELRRFTHTLRKGAKPVAMMLQRSAVCAFESGCEWFPRGSVLDISAVTHLLQDGPPFLPVYDDADWIPVEKRTSTDG